MEHNSENDREYKDEATIHIGEDFAENKTTISPDILENSEESGSDTTTVVDTTGEYEVTSVHTITAETTEENLDTQNTLDEDGNDMEKTTTRSPADDDDAPTEAPRFDIKSETKNVDTINAPQVDETTNVEKLTSIPIVDGTEPTTVAIISIEETDDKVTFVTTEEPCIQGENEDDEKIVL